MKAMCQEQMSLDERRRARRLTSSESSKWVRRGQNEEGGKVRPRWSRRGDVILKMQLATALSDSHSVNCQTSPP